MTAPPSTRSPAVPGYVLQELLGRGGSGEVWRAAPRSGGEPVAIKVLVAGDPERQAREAALLGELDHPHLVRLREVVHQPSRGGVPRVALVLDLLAGGSLAALLAERGRLRPGEVVTAIAPVAAALAHAHEHGVVHGDLSPGNVVFTADGRPVLTDLGVARVLGETAAAEVTPAYVDPTVARGGAPGPASDVFGVAAAAFHALTGVAPWNGATPADVLAVAAAGLLPDLDELAPDAPAALRAVVTRGLDPDPSARGSAAAFALDLRHACRPEPVRLPVAGLAAPDLGRTGRGPRTELTHQVPGRRPREAPVVVGRGEASRWERLGGVAGVRGLLRRFAVVLVVGAALGGAAWLGDRWAGSSDGGGRDAGAAVATPSPPAPESGPSTTAPSAAAPAVEVSRDALPETSAAPTSPTGWQELVAELYRRRAAAFTSGAAEPLDGVYTEASPLLAADRAALAELTAAGEVLRGFAPAVVEVTAAQVSGGRAELELVDRWPAAAVVPAGAPEAPGLREVPGRGDARVRMVVLLTAAGWRIDDAQRLG